MENKVEDLEKKNKELSSCTIIKNILAILIVFYHTLLMFSADQWDFGFFVEEVKVIHYIKYFIMPLPTRTFFIISGYIYAFLKLEKNNYPSYSKFVFNKFLRLMVPFIVIGFFMIIPIKYFVGLTTIKEALINFLLGRNCDQLWFIVALFLIFVIVYPFDKLLDKNPIVSLIISLALVGLAVGLDEFLNISCGLTQALKNLPFFLIGYLFRKNGTEIIRSKTTLIIGSLVYLLIFASYVTFNEVNIESLNNIAIIVYDPLYFFGAPILFGLLLNLFDNIDLNNNKLHVFLSKHSMNIYLFHQQILYLFILLLINKINPYLFVLIIFPIVTLISLGLSLLFRTNKVTRFLLGEKVKFKE